MNKLVIAGKEIRPGQNVRMDLPIARLYTDTDVALPIQIIRGKHDGPCVFISAAIHGDELNGIEIISRLISSKSFKIRNGTLIVIPMVNIYGVLQQTRYMPDRRDLNRSFPGSPKGSLAGRLADTFLTEIVSKCQYGIDMHTGSLHRSNLPQVRADLNCEETRELAMTFGVPVILHSNTRDGSLREAAVESGAKVLLYEGGEALRFDELSIRAGIKGIMNVLGQLGLTNKPKRKRTIEPFIAYNSTWMRANYSGIVRHNKKIGDVVAKNDVLANIGGPFGEIYGRVKARHGGVIIGKQNIPLVQEGDAMFHIARFDDYDDEDVAESIENLQETLIPTNNELNNNY